MSRKAFLLSIIAVCAMAEARPPTQLESVSSALDPSSHSITVTLVNHSGKKIVAYVMEVHQFDAAGKPIGQPLTVGTDNVFSLIYGEDAPALISLGAELPKQLDSLSPDSVSAEASVIAVVYLDRTAEGDQKQIALLRKNRAMHAQHAEAAAALLADYPTSPTETHSRLSKLAAIRERTATVDQMLHSDGVPDKGQWSAAAAQEKVLAELLIAQSKAAE